MKAGVSRPYTMLLSGIVVVTLLCGCATVRKRGVTADDILDRWAQAIGGIGRLRQIENAYVRGTVEVGGLHGTLESWYTARGQLREQIDLGGVINILTVFDGERGEGWVRDQNGKVQELAGTDLESEVTSMYLGTYSQFIPGRMLGNVEFVGRDETHQYNIVRIRPEGGRVATYYLDRDTDLPFKVEYPSGEQTLTQYLSDWRDVDGVKLPFHTRNTTGDPQYDQIITIQEVRFNGQLDETAFRRPQEAPRDYRFASGQSSPEIPFELYQDLIFVRVRVNDSDPLWFVLDTGAGASVIDSERAKALGLDLQGTVEGRGAGAESFDVAFVKGVSFQLPGVELFGQTVAAMPLGSLAPYLGRATDGVLGYDFISRFVVEIDYAQKLVRLYDPQSYRYSGSGEVVPFTIERNHVHIRAHVVKPGRDPVEGTFTIDTGSSGALDLTRPFIEKTGLFDPNQKTITAYVMGAGGEGRILVGRVSELRIGNFVMEEPVTGFSQAEAGAFASPDIAGLIGAQILKGFTVFFDYTHHQMILEPNEHFGKPYEFDKSGVRLIAEGLDFTVFKVHRVIEDTPASEAGLREGDIITAIDGQPAEKLGLDMIDEMFMQEGREYRLSILRGEKQFEIRLKLRRLI